MPFQLPDATSPFGERIARRLREESIIWLTLVDAKGMPQTAPVWFWWDEKTASFLIYSLNNAKRLAHLQKNPSVSLNFDGDGKGGDIIVFTGQVQVNPTEISADKHQPYLEKYRAASTQLFGSPESFAEKYSIALRVYPSQVRGH